MRLITIAFLLSFLTVPAQVPRTIFANDKEVVALFFPTAISQAMTGSTNFLFSYNREAPQNVGILQGSRGEGSNLLVLTENGDVYSYGLAYRKKLDTLNHFIPITDRIGNEVPEPSFFGNDSMPGPGIPKTMDIKELEPPVHDREYLRKRSSYHLGHSKGTLKQKRKNGLILRLRNLIFERMEVYAILEIENRSEIDFELNYLKLYKINGRKSRRSSYQKQELEPIYVQGFPTKAKVGESRRYIAALPKFTLGESEILLLEMDEFHGARKLKMEVKSTR